MPVVLLALRSVLLSVLSSRLTRALAQHLRRLLSAASSRFAAALRHVWERLRSQESKEAILGCVLCILNMHKKVDSN
ncbi:protein myomixer-like [Colossoma macropomum]|uniref:protein myomixer-like n=1 Tax=Colossoma macropomum TaxID=42526 RepID=UPI001864BDF0|nr:protein myomixer-like [Colossoma macropomum]